MHELTLTRMFQRSVREFGPKAAMKHKRDGVWHTITYDGYARYVQDFANGLMALGVSPGDRIAIWAGNRPEWSITDFACLHAAAVDAPIYPTLLEDQVEYILNDCKARVLVVDTAERLAKACGMLGRVPSLQHIVSMDPVPAEYRGKAEVLGFDDVYARGRAFGEERPDEFSRRSQAVAPEALATLIYTSGTTGKPKGVMLTHLNLTSNAEAACAELQVTEKDTHLSFLPLCHSYERLAGHYVMVLRGATVAFAESIEKVLQNIKAVSYTHLTLPTNREV